MNSEYFNQLLEEYRLLCEQYRIRNKYHFIDIRVKDKYVNVLLWTIKKSKIPTITYEGNKKKFTELSSLCKIFHKTHIVMQIEILKISLNK